MLKRYIDFFKELKTNQLINIKLSKEIIWANVYHDSIRGKAFLENLPLNIGRWAGSYAFFYVLHRVLNDCKPVSILELGLGESTKFISKYIENELTGTKHVVVEQSTEWAEGFLKTFELANNVEIITLPIETVTIEKFEVKRYKGLLTKITQDHEIYVVDGPHGSKRFSRYDIVDIIKNRNAFNDFLVIIDDYNRVGEKDTVKELLKLLESKSVNYVSAEYKGEKSVFLIGVGKFKFINSL